jgi:CRP/FNR family nitrogen fixation transcriptional regulator
MTAPFVPGRMQDRATALTADGLGEVIAQMGLKMAFARDEEIFAQEQDADLVYLLVQGAVRTTRLMSDGRRQIGEFYLAGDLFGLEVAAVRKFSAEALSDCVVQVVKRSALRELARTDPGIERMMWLASSDELERAHDHILLLGRKTACEKVASLLMGMAARHGFERAELPKGRQDMADYLGLTIETVSRMLTQLQASAVIRFSGVRSLTVANPAALARLAG